MSCVQPAHEKIGVVDAQWIVHQGIPSLGDQVIFSLFMIIPVVLKCKLFPSNADL